MADPFLSQLIRAVRERRRLSQAQLAALCSPPRAQANVATWESGTRPLSEATLETVAQALGLSVRELLAEGLRATKPSPQGPRAAKPEEPPPGNP